VFPFGEQYSGFWFLALFSLVDAGLLRFFFCRPAGVTFFAAATKVIKASRFVCF
jgi:hypothetical protein